MKRLLPVLMLLALPLAAQEAKLVDTISKPVPNVQKLFMLKYADPENLNSLLRVFPVSMVPNRDLRALGVSGPPEAVAAVEDAIKRLDIPSAAPANIDITVYLMVGREGENPPGSSATPKDLDSVVTQLKNAFAFKNYSLMDVLSLRTRTGQQASTTSSGGALQFQNGGPQPVTTTFNIRAASIGSDGSTVRIDGIQTGSKVPVPRGNDSAYQDLGIRTDIDIKEGQKVVVGRLGISKDQALFLVMTVKIVP